MGERTGTGVVECAILEALDSLGARSGQHYCKNSTVLAAVEERIGLAPGYAYEVLLDLARPWTMPVSLVTGRGNLGSRGNDPAANPPYTESRLSPAGQVALAAERGDLAPVPIGLINGNVHRYGSRPPFRPRAIIEALRQVIRRPGITSEDLTDIVGPPCFLNGCTVTGDFAALAEGRPATLRLQADVTVSNGSVLITNLPPNANPDDIAHSLASLAAPPNRLKKYPDLHRHVRLPISDIRDESSRRLDTDLLVCVPEPGTPPDQLRDQLTDVYGVYTEVAVALPQPLATILRGWADAYRSEDLQASLTALENAIQPGT
jgi:hypothetical protein